MRRTLVVGVAAVIGGCNLISAAEVARRIEAAMPFAEVEGLDLKSGFGCLAAMARLTAPVGLESLADPVANPDGDGLGEEWHRIPDLGALVADDGPLADPRRRRNAGHALLDSRNCAEAVPAVDTYLWSDDEVMVTADDEGEQLLLLDPARPDQVLYLVQAP